jgi:hypothetical protein
MCSDTRLKNQDFCRLTPPFVNWCYRRTIKIVSNTELPSDYQQNDNEALFYVAPN